MLEPVIHMMPALIVDSDLATQARLCRLLAGLTTTAVQAQVAADLATAQVLLRETRFSLALIHARLPDGSGVALIDWMRQHAPTVATVLVVASIEADTTLAGFQAGAIGYLRTSQDDHELTESLRAVQRGGSLIDPIIARRILALIPHDAPPAQLPSPIPAADAADALQRCDAPASRLSCREREILRWLVCGYSNAEIAGLAVLSKLTIETHVKNIFRKLSVGSRTAAVFEARALGLLG